MCPTVYPEHDAWELIGLAWETQRRKNKQETDWERSQNIRKGEREEEEKGKGNENYFFYFLHSFTF